MLAYLVRRILISIPLVLGIVTITFVMMRLAPGDPMDIYLEPQRQRQMDPEVIELLREKYGLDQPIHIQYVRWVSAMANGDFGESFRHRRPVSKLLAEAIPYTLQLTILALLFDALIGITLGVVAAVGIGTVTSLLYVSANLPGAARVGGIQGRYFLPFVAVALAALPVRSAGANRVGWVVAIGSLIGLVATSQSLVARYYPG